MCYDRGESKKFGMRWSQEASRRKCLLNCVFVSRNLLGNEKGKTEFFFPRHKSMMSLGIIISSVSMLRRCLPKSNEG